MFVIRYDTGSAVWFILVLALGLSSCCTVVFQCCVPAQTLSHQFGFENPCQRHMVLKTWWGCLLLIGNEAGTADWWIIWLWACPDDSLLVSSAVCLPKHSHTNLESTITVRDIWCLKLGGDVCY
jgi:hypothetical protein